MYFSAAELNPWISLEKKLYHTAAHVAVRSDLIRRSLIQDYGVLDNKISVVGGGVNFTSLPTQVEHARKKNPVVLFIGHDFTRKGGDLVLRAFAKVLEQTPLARLILVTGQTIPSDLPVENVEVRAPVWQRESIAALYRQADIFILPSRQETWGDVLLEAMAFGVPCIGVTGQAMESIIEDDVTGLLVPPENVDALAQALEKLLADLEMRGRMGRNSRMRIENKNTWADVVEQLLPVLTM